ncbi:MAG: hypothetical protein L0216_02380 [Planctomycetales bacterium]|nr:hypothetical protein [Planctomycetales bacterium]
MGQGLGTLAAGLALGIGLGLAGGWALFGRGEAPALLPPAAAPAGPAPGPAAPPPGSAPATPAPAASVPARTLADLVAPVPVPESARGTGTISGTVTADDGPPVEGVVVRGSRVADSEGRPRGSGAPEVPDIERHLRRAAEEYRRDRAGESEARTDAQGRYSLSGLADGEHAVSAWKVGWEIKPRGHGGGQRTRPGDRLDFLATAVIEVPVAVLGPDGAEAASATIECVVPSGRGSSTSREAWSHARSSVRLRPGTCRLRAVAGGTTSENEDPRLQSDEQSVTVPREGGVARVTLALKEAPGIRGRVLDPEGGDEESVSVYALKAPPEAAPDPKQIKESGKRVYVGGAHGTFCFRDLPPGTYLVGAARGWDGPVVVTESVAVTDRMETRDLALPPPDPGAEVLVRVLGSSGESLADVTFGYRYEEKGSSSSGGVQAVRRPDGSWRISPSEEFLEAYRSGKPDSGVKISVTATSASHGSKTLELPVGQPAPATIRFGPPATLEVTVDGYAGSEFAGRVKLKLQPAKDKPDPHAVHMRWHEGTSLGAEGRATLGPVESGEYLLLVLVGAGERRSWESVPAAKVPVSLAPGSRSLRVAMPTLYRLAVIVDGAPKGTQVNLGPAEDAGDWWGSQADTDESGRALFDRVPAGKHTLRVWGTKNAGQMAVTIPDQSEVRFQPAAENVVGVWISDESGYLAQIGFQNGDKVTGMDGTEFRDRAHMVSLVMAATGKPEVKLAVLRGEKRLEIGASPEKLLRGLMDERSLGGRMYPTSR